MRDKRFRVLGRVRGARTRAPKPGLHVKAFDRDLVFDDDLGDTVTNERGEFFLEFTEKAFREVFERRPDLYVRVFDATGTELLATTERAVRWDASPVEHFEIDIPEE
ncbi:MAG: transthyretin-like family protein [Myxococcales bacterium]|nr:transthyretin-like family protein [Myxococcales bacterium]